MLNLLIIIMPPACTTKVGISGTERTLNPLVERSSWMRLREVLLPPHGPPVMTILQMGCSAEFLIDCCSTLSLRQTWLSAFQNSLTPTCLDSSAVLSKALSSSFSCLSLWRWQKVAKTPPKSTTSVLCSATFSTTFPIGFYYIQSTHCLAIQRVTEILQNNKGQYCIMTNAERGKEGQTLGLDNNSKIKQQTMTLLKLLQSSLKLLTLKGQNHSISEAICSQYLLDNNHNMAILINALHDSLANEQLRSELLDWANVFLFNLCACNEERLNQLENQMLESTEDYHHFAQNGSKIDVSNAAIAKKMRSNVASLLQAILALPFFQRIFAEVKPKNVIKSKSLRSLLETIDYATYKYEIKLKGKEEIMAQLSTIDRKTENQLLFDKANWLNKRLFAGAEQLVDFLNEIRDNYTVNLAAIAQIVSANYFNITPSRKIFESANNSGEVITEEIVDFMIRKCNKGDLFSQKLDNYRPFQLLMEILLQKFGHLLLHFNSIIDSMVKHSHTSLYSPQNYKKIQAFVSIFSYELQNNYPHLAHLLRYMHESLCAKYSQSDSLELMKKFLLNRLLLNPFYYALLYSPSQQEMERYVKIVNELRILFYEKKMESIPENFRSSRLNEVADMLRNSLVKLIYPKEDEGKLLHRHDQGVYINDTLLGGLFFQVSDSLKGNKNKSKVSNSELHSQSSLSFSLRNDSASRMQIPSTQNIPLISNIYSNNSLPHLPKPTQKSNHQKVDPTQRNTSKIVSTDAYLSVNEEPTIGLEELVNMRRQYGELKRQIEVRTAQKCKNRESWLRQLYLNNDEVNERIKEISKSSSEHMINTVLL